NLPGLLYRSLDAPGWADVHEVRLAQPPVHLQLEDRDQHTSARNDSNHGHGQERKRDRKHPPDRVDHANEVDAPFLRSMREGSAPAGPSLALAFRNVTAEDVLWRPSSASVGATLSSESAPNQQTYLAFEH